MATINTMASQSFLAVPNTHSILTKSKSFLTLPLSSYIRIAAITVARARMPRPLAAAVARTDGIDVLPGPSDDSTDQQGGVAPHGREEEASGLDQSGPITSQIGGFAFDSGAGGGGGGVGFSLSSSTSGSPMEGEDQDKMIDRSINASIVLVAGTFAITKLLTIDMDYWHGWTIYEIVRYAPQHNWTAYEDALKTNPVLAKMMISGVVYSIGDWIAQAGWKLWPFTHLITYGAIPVEQRLLWVDCVELVWVMILSTYSNETSEARHSEAMSELSAECQSAVPEEMTK